MSFGKRLGSAAKGYVNGGPVGAALGFGLPQSKSTNAKNSNYQYITPYGRIKYSGNSARYTPIYTPDQQEGLNLADAGALESLKALKAGIQPGSDYAKALQDLPSNLDINSYFNNPFRDTTRQLLSNPIKQKFNLDQQQLTNDLNASNQLGGSYAALRLNQLQQNQNNDLQTADLQSVNASADAYRQLISQKQDRVQLFQKYYENLLNQLSGYQQYSNNVAGKNIPNYFK